MRTDIGLKYSLITSEFQLVLILQSQHKSQVRGVSGTSQIKILVTAYAERLVMIFHYTYLINYEPCLGFCIEEESLRQMSGFT
jgi:hypothetical protein